MVSSGVVADASRRAHHRHSLPFLPVDRYELKRNCLRRILPATASRLRGRRSSRDSRHRLLTSSRQLCPTFRSNNPRRHKPFTVRQRLHRIKLRNVFMQKQFPQQLPQLAFRLRCAQRSCCSCVIGSLASLFHFTSRRFIRRFIHRTCCKVNVNCNPMSCH